MLMTVKMTSSGTFDVKTQPLTGTPSNTTGVDPVLNGLTPSTAIPALDASFTVSATSGNNYTATVTGPYYVTASGGQITANLNLGASNLDTTTASGTLSANGTLSNGSGGISLSSATLGTDTTLTLLNAYGFDEHFSQPGAAPPPHGITGRWISAT